MATLSYLEPYSHWQCQSIQQALNFHLLNFCIPVFGMSEEEKMNQDLASESRTPPRREELFHGPSSIIELTFATNTRSFSFHHHYRQASCLLLLQMPKILIFFTRGIISMPHLTSSAFSIFRNKIHQFVSQKDKSTSYPNYLHPHQGETLGFKKQLASLANFFEFCYLSLEKFSISGAFLQV